MFVFVIGILFRLDVLIKQYIRKNVVIFKDLRIYKNIIKFINKYFFLFKLELLGKKFD